MPIVRYYLWLWEDVGMNCRKVEFHPEISKLSDEHIALNFAFYTYLSEYYFKFFEFSHEMLTRTYYDYTKKFIDCLKKTNMNNPVLILGAGGGRDAFWISRVGMEVHLVDVSLSMIEFSKKVFTAASYFCQDMNDFLKSVESNSLVYSGIMNESASQHLGKDQIYEQIQLVSNSLSKDGIYLLGLKQSPFDSPTGPIYSVSEEGHTRFFISWSESELTELIQFAQKVGLHLVHRVESTHLKSAQGTPSFIRLYFSPTP